MASYKVIQDIEAEDKLVGPLTLRQFIYGVIAAFCAYMSFIALTKDFSIALVVLVPPMLFTGFFAFPWGRDQPTEVWALAKIRYFVKSRKRIWNQSGVKDLVTVTAPKRLDKRYTNGLSAPEVESRLTALATTLDSRGWATKNVFTAPIVTTASDDRLIGIDSLPQAVPMAVVPDADDMLDEVNNPRAHQLQEMVTASTANHKQQLLDQMRSGTMPAPAASNASWFTQRPIAVPQPIAAQPVATDITANDEAALLDKLHAQHNLAEAAAGNDRIKTIEPPEMRPAVVPAATPPSRPAPAVTAKPDPVTINLANNNDLNVATIARIANKQDLDSGGEVVISLHNR